MADKTPIHQWTNGGNKVLLVKCVGKDGRGHGGFQWPKLGPVDPGECSLEPTCESGGLFGWAWGLNLGGGKEPDYSGCWIVFAADPAIVVEIDGEKHKAAGACEVVYYGDWAGALTYTMAGRLAWLGHVTENAESQSSRLRGAASATGWSGAASATGENSSIEIGPEAAGVCTAREFTWIYHAGAVLLARWPEGHKTFVGDLGYAEGARVLIRNGEIVEVR